jgi:hypothetical protein
MVIGLAVIIGSIMITTAGEPKLDIDSHHDDETVNAEKITVYGHVRGTGGAVVELVTVNGVRATGDTEWGAKVSLLPGPNTITVVATDDIGNSATRTITVILASEPIPIPAGEPELYIDSHYDGETVNAEKITVYGHVRGTGGAVVELVTVNGVNATGDTEWSAEVSLLPGPNTITVVASDDIGNSATRTITVILASEPTPIPTYKIYNRIRTVSYPQIIHESTKDVLVGV